MEKKNIYILMAFLVLALSIIIFLIANKEDEFAPNGAPFSSFVVTNFGNTSFVENDMAGVNFIVPEDWEVVSDYLAAFSMRTKDFIPFNDRMISASIPKKGCWIGVSVSFEKEGSSEDAFYTSSKVYIEDPKLLGDNREVIEIDGIKALKETIVNEENNPGKVEMVWIPFNDTVYHFQSNLFGEDQEECENHFNNFLKTISIRK